MISQNIRALGRRLYPLSPVWVQEALLAGYFYSKSKTLYGDVFHTSRRQLEISQWLDAQALYRLQCERLETIVAAAFRTPYYHRLFRELKLTPADIRCPEDLRKIPVLEKSELIKNPRDFINSDTENPLSTTTSGTTGSPLTLFFSARFEAVEEAFLDRQYAWAGFDYRSRRVKLRGDLVVPASDTRTKTIWRHNAPLNELRISSYHLTSKTVAACVDRINAFEPQVLIAYPSSASLLAALIRDKRLKCSIPRVFLSSETLFPGQRRLIEEIFETQVFDHYGQAESVAMIQQCEHGSYHIVPEYGVTELIADKNNSESDSCEIVATGFLNETMPLLRYRTGDSVIVTKETEPCRCGRVFPRVEQIVGRDEDLIQSRSGGWGMLMLENIFDQTDIVVESQVIQNQDLSVNVLIVPGSRYENRCAESIKAHLLQRFGIADVVVEKVSGIPRGPNGKFRPVISAAVYCESTANDRS